MRAHQFSDPMSDALPVRRLVLDPCLDLLGGSIHGRRVVEVQPKFSRRGIQLSVLRLGGGLGGGLLGQLVDVDLVLRLAQICDAYLQQADRAAQLLKEQLRLNPADEDVALRLETILRREGKREDLRWVLELKVEQAQSDEARIHTLTDWARLEGDTFRDFEQASELYRRLLELQPGNIEALRARVHLLLEAGGHATAATTCGCRSARSPGRRASAPVREPAGR